MSKISIPPARFVEKYLDVALRATELAAKRKNRKVVTRRGRGARGFFPSWKAPAGARYESLVEEAVQKVCEVSSLVTSFLTHSRVLQLTLDADNSTTYTPDVEILSGGSTLGFLEVKSDTSLASQSVQTRLRTVIDGMRSAELPLWVILESDVRANGLQERISVMLRDRPAPGRYREDRDVNLWDPSGDAREADDDVSARWLAAQKECDELLQRVMRRDPDDLLECVEAR